MLPQSGDIAVALALILFGFGAAFGGSQTATGIFFIMAVVWSLWHFWTSLGSRK